jgi:hypothetical protein
MSKKYRINLDNKVLDIYEHFIDDYKYMIQLQDKNIYYYGASNLDELKIDKFHDYLIYCKLNTLIYLKEIDPKTYILELSVPFTNKFIRIKLENNDNKFDLINIAKELYINIEDKTNIISDLSDEIKQKNKEINKLYHIIKKLNKCKN